MNELLNWEKLYPKDATTLEGTGLTPIESNCSEGTLSNLHWSSAHLSVLVV